MVSSNRPGSEQDGEDKRYLPRWHVFSRVTYLLGNGDPPQLAKTKDLHCAGACLITESQLKPDSVLDLTIHLSEYEHVRVHGKVVWSFLHQGMGQAGISFEATDEQQELILNQAYAVNKKEVVNQWFKGWV